MTSASTVTRSSTAYAQWTIASTVASSAFGSASARKPTWPRLTPSIGTPAGRASSAARRNVPSPPRVSATSAPAAASSPFDRDDTGHVDVRSLVGEHPDGEPARDELPRRAGRLLADLAALGVRDEQDRSAGHRAPTSPLMPLSRSSRSARRSGRRRGARRSHRKNSTLPDGPGSGLRTHPGACPAELARQRGDAQHRTRREGPDRAPLRRCPAARGRPRTAA